MFDLHGALNIHQRDRLITTQSLHRRDHCRHRDRQPHCHTNNRPPGHRCRRSWRGGGLLCGCLVGSRISWCRRSVVRRGCAGRCTVGRCGSFVASATAARVAGGWSSGICTCGAFATFGGVAPVGVCTCERLAITRQPVATHVADLIACVPFSQNDAVPTIPLTLLAVEVRVAYT